MLSYVKSSSESVLVVLHRVAMTEDVLKQPQTSVWISCTAKVPDQTVVSCACAGAAANRESAPSRNAKREKRARVEENLFRASGNARRTRRKHLAEEIKTSP